MTSIEVQAEPVFKKPRLDDEEEEEDGYCSDDDSDLFANGFNNQMNDEEYRLYVDAVVKSRGFDVPYYPKPIDCGVIPVTCLFSNRAYYDEVEQCSIFALHQHNNATGKKYKLHKLVKANMTPCAGTVYYITFVAEDLTEVGESGNVVAAGGDGESEKVGPSGGPLVEFQAQTGLHLPDKQRKCKIEVFYFGAKPKESQ